MKICFSTSSYQIDELKNDYNAISKDLPCNVEPIFDVNVESAHPNDIAVTLYSTEQIKLGYPIIEVNPQYFVDFSEGNRRLILLHEIIHACQRTNELSELNRKYMIDLRNRLNQLVTDYVTKHNEDECFQAFRATVYAIGMFSTWIFEIWAELFLKERYPHYFDDKMKVTFDTIDSQYKKGAYEWCGIWAKIPVFIEMIRANYLKKITEGKPVSASHEGLYQKWRERLGECVDQEEYNELMGRVESLTDISAYERSNTKILENAYDPAIDMMISSFNFLFQ